MQEYFAQYNVPRIQLGSKASFTHANNKKLTFVPGTTTPVTFILGNHEGRLLNVNGLTNAEIVFWKTNSILTDSAKLGQGEIVFKKIVLLDDPYANTIDVVFSIEETNIIAQSHLDYPLNMSISLTNSDSSVRYPLTIGYKDRYFDTIDVVYTGVPLWDSNATKST